MRRARRGRGAGWTGQRGFLREVERSGFRAHSRRAGGSGLGPPAAGAPRTPFLPESSREGSGAFACLGVPTLHCFVGSGWNSLQTLELIGIRGVPGAPKSWTLLGSARVGEKLPGSRIVGLELTQRLWKLPESGNLPYLSPPKEQSSSV